MLGWEIDERIVCAGVNVVVEEEEEEEEGWFVDFRKSTSSQATQQLSSSCLPQEPAIPSRVISVQVPSAIGARTVTSTSSSILRNGASAARSKAVVSAPPRAGSVPQLALSALVVLGTEWSRRHWRCGRVSPRWNNGISRRLL
jgi:hypothetical protein